MARCKHSDDVVIIPAFGTEVTTRQELEQRKAASSWIRPAAM